jgi:hypothetical protein
MDKLFSIYYKFIDYPQIAKKIFPSLEKIDDSEIITDYMILAILDLLYMMYLQKDSLDKGLLKTWNFWATKIYRTPRMKSTLKDVEDEYDTQFILDLHKAYKK